MSDQPCFPSQYWAACNKVCQDMHVKPSVDTRGMTIMMMSTSIQFALHGVLAMAAQKRKHMGRISWGSAL